MSNCFTPWVSLLSGSLLSLPKGSHASAVRNPYVGEGCSESDHGEDGKDLVITCWARKVRFSLDSVRERRERKWYRHDVVLVAMRSGEVRSEPAACCDSSSSLGKHYSSNVKSESCVSHQYHVTM